MSLPAPPLPPPPPLTTSTSTSMSHDDVDDINANWLPVQQPHFFVNWLPLQHPVDPVAVAVVAQCTSQRQFRRQKGKSSLRQGNIKGKERGSLQKFAFSGSMENAIMETDAGICIRLRNLQNQKMIMQARAKARTKAKARQRAYVRTTYVRTYVRTNVRTYVSTYVRTYVGTWWDGASTSTTATTATTGTKH